MPKALRVKDVYYGRTVALEQSEYNTAVRRWAMETQRFARQAASAFSKGKRKPTHTYQSGPKAGKVEQKLSRSIQFKLQADAGDVSAVFFRFPLHGVFREYGVGSESPHGHVSRSLSDWLSSTLDRQQQKLLEIACEHQAETVLRVFRGINK